MPDLDFAVESVAVEPYAAAPLLRFRLRVTDRDAPPRPVHSVALHCQLRIEPTQRRYDAVEQQRLRELFGLPEQWRHSVRSLLWTHAQVVIPAFTGGVNVDLPVACSYDLGLAATKYFDGLQTGEIPLTLLFSGTVFFAAPAAPLQVAPISWNREATCRLPVNVWRELMDRYYPNGAWLCLQRDVVERLRAYQRRAGLPTWEQAIETLLAREPEVIPCPPR
jgi:hypothetical protein